MRRAERVAAGAAVVVVVVAIVVVVVLAARSPKRAPPRALAPRASAEQLGVNVNRLFDGHPYSQAQVDAQLREVASTGVTVARSDALWEVTEPRPPTAGGHHFDWSFDDEIAGSLAAHGLRWLALLDYSAPWAESVPGQDHSAPRSAADFAAFAGALAARYGPDGGFWRAHPELRAQPVQTFEVWNEPDNPSFWHPSPNAAQYAELYLATRAAIAAVDPSARVIVGGLTDPASFLPAMLAARPALARQVEGVAIHPYGATPAAVLARVAAARRALDSAGLGAVPLYVTEFGWTTSPPGALNYAPEAIRGAYVETTLAELAHTDCGIAAALLYTWITPRRDAANPQDWYGLGSASDVAALASGLHAASADGAVDGVCG